MDSKQAHAIIETEKSTREIKRLAELQAARRYRVYWVNPITSLLHQLPFTDIRDESEGADVRLYLFFDCSCPLEEVRNAIAAADAGKMGVCIRSRWTTYLVERLS